MAKATETALGGDGRHPIADNGYFAGSEILTYHRTGITTTVPRPEINWSNGMFVKANFLYEAERDVYRCPAGNELTTATRERKAGYRSGYNGSTTPSTARFGPAAPPARLAGSPDGSTSTWSTRCESV